MALVILIKTVTDTSVDSCLVYPKVLSITDVADKNKYMLALKGYSVLGNALNDGMMKN